MPALLPLGLIIDIVVNARPRALLDQSSNAVYVSNAGNDANSGASAAQAKQTLQAGIAAVGAGGIVYLEPGSYTGAGDVGLSFNEEDITVRSDPANGGSAANTIIDLSGSTGVAAFTFSQGESSAARLIGLTFENGNRPGGRGGAITVGNGSSPTIEECIFKNNKATYGGAIGVIDASPIIRECTFTDNDAIADGNSADPITGGAIDLILDGAAQGVVRPVITNCVFQGNKAAWDGGAIDISGDSAVFSPAITNCTFHGNVSTRTSRSEPGGAIGIYSGSPIITNCILFGDTGGEIAFVTDPAPTTTAQITVSHSDIVQSGYGGNGDIDADPKFAADLGLVAGSPCLGAGTSTAPDGVDISTDRSGAKRGNPPSMGAYEQPGPAGLK